MNFNPRTGKATILLGREFVSQHAHSPLKLGALIMHELFHHLLHHYVFYPTDRISNLAQDIVINATICRLASSFQQLFTEVHDKNQFPSNALRPAANIRRIENPDLQVIIGTMYKQLYRKVNHWMLENIRRGARDADVLTVDEVRGVLLEVATKQEALQKANEAAGKETMDGLKGLIQDWWLNGNEDLLGDHTDKNTEDQLSSEDLEEDFKDSLKDMMDGIAQDIMGNPNAAGLFQRAFAIKGEDSPEALIEAMAKGLQEDIMRCKEITSAVVGDALSHVTVVPKHVGRKELAQLAAGTIPTFWPAYGPEEKPEGSANVYLDVSGSMGDQAAFIMMLLTNFKTQIDTEFYQFSTEIVPTDFGKLVEHYENTGEVFTKTTGGTDFDPIFEHAQEHGFEKVILITDGMARLGPQGTDFAKSIHTFVVFTNDHSPEPLAEVAEQHWVMPQLTRKT